MSTSPIRDSTRKRKADEVTVDESEDVNIAVVEDEPPSKKAKTNHVETIHKRWNADMEVPQGRPRPTFLGETEEKRRYGSGTTEDPMVIWLGKIPLSTEVREANEDIAQRAASTLQTVTHIYIRYAAQSSKFVDRDGQRIHIFNPDSIFFHHRTTAADPHMSLAFGTETDNLSLYGYINVAMDDNGTPTDFAASRNPDHADGDERIFELFTYEDQQQDCAPYCPTHEASQGYLTIIVVEPVGELMFSMIIIAPVFTIRQASSTIIALVIMTWLG